jgi:orotidine-5'-phosphate decarboxylase
MVHFGDRLFDAARAKGTPLCVGLDPRYEQLPLAVRRCHPDTLDGRGQAYEAFCRRVIDLVAPHVAVVKPQSAFFEACGPAGFTALAGVTRYAKDRGLLTILDAKRNDIASTAAAYAEAAFDALGADALTVNPYLGRDSIEPFLQHARPRGRGLFVLVRTSNAGAGQFQDLVCDGRPLHTHVAAAVTQWCQENIGKCGYGDVGAVVGATSPAELVALRGRLPGVPLLVPGYGAQGGTAADTAAAFAADGLGAVVNSSRAILFPYAPGADDWEAAVERATRQAVADLAAHTPAGRLRA